MRGERQEPVPAWLLAAPIVALALVLVFSTQHGWWVNDNKFLLYWKPGRGLREMFSAWLSGRDLGGARQGYSPATFAYVGALRALGAPAWVAERLFHATLMAVGGLGAALVGRALRPRSWVVPVVAGTWFVASPFTVGFLLPSWLYLNAALAPWIFLAVLRGLTTTSTWRWAAAVAVCAFAAGSLNLPGLAFAALPVLALIAYLRVTGQVGWRRVGTFALQAGGLALLVFLPSLTQVAAGSDVLGRNLAVTESAEAVSQSSSWPESLRGLGGWLLYFNLGGRATLAYARPFFTEPFVVLVTFVPVVAAFWVIGWTRWRPRLLLGLVLLLSTAAMVGGFPPLDPPPLGWLLLESYEEATATFAFRSTYKAGPGLVLAVGVLLGMAVDAALRRAGRRIWVVAATWGVLGVVVATTTAPFWTGGVYGPSSSRVDEIPAYWEEATTWLDAAPGEARALILPSASVPAYTWGTPAGGDLFPSLLDRPFLLQEPFPGGPPLANDVVAGVASQLSTGSFLPGAAQPVLARLGVGYVVVRNDLDPGRAGSPPPAALDAVRQDPDLELVATFGAPGQGAAVTEGDVSRPPVEVYRVRGVDEVLRLAPAGGTLVVSGDGEAWLGVAGSGAFEGGAPLQYSGQLDDAELRAALDAGSSVTVTDTNRRRRASLAVASGATVTVAEAGSGLFADPATQSVATYGDASAITEVGTLRLTSPPPARRPAAATDGDPTTAWLTGAGLPFQPQGLRVALVEPQPLTRVELTTADPALGREVVAADLVLPDGSQVPFSFDGRRATATVPSASVASFTVLITEVAGPGAGGFGLAEISADGLDLAEVVRAPTDIVDAARRDAAVADGVAEAELTYLFQRLGGEELEVEPQLRRRFDVPGTRDFDLIGSWHADEALPDRELALLLGLAVTAVSDERAGGVATAGPLAVDGDLSTGWSVPADGGELDLDLGGQTVAAVTMLLDGTAAAAGRVSVSADGEELSATEGGGRACTIVADACVVELDLPVGRAADQLTLQVTPGLASDLAPRVLEVRIDGRDNAPVPTRLPEVCRPMGLRLDGEPLVVTVDGATADLLAGGPLGLSSCSAETLTAGWHELDAVSGVVVDRIELRSPGRAPATTAPGSLDVGSRSSTRIEVDVDAPSGGWLMSGQAPSAGWAADIDGERAEPPAVLDAQTAFPLEPAPTSRSATLSYGPQTTLIATVALSSVGLAGCLVLLVWDPRRGRPAIVASLAPWAPAVVWTAYVAGCGLVAGLAGLVWGVASAFALGTGRVPARWAAVGAMALLAITVAAYLPPLGPSLEPFGTTWVSQRDLANSAGRLASLFLAGAVVRGLIELAPVRPRSPDTPDDQEAEARPAGQPAAAAASSAGARSSTTSSHVRR